MRRSSASGRSTRRACRSRTRTGCWGTSSTRSRRCTMTHPQRSARGAPKWHASTRLGSSRTFAASASGASGTTVTVACSVRCSSAGGQPTRTMYVRPGGDRWAAAAASQRRAAVSSGVGVTVSDFICDSLRRSVRGRLFLHRVCTRFLVCETLSVAAVRDGYIATQCCFLRRVGL